MKREVSICDLCKNRMCELHCDLCGNDTCNYCCKVISLGTTEQGKGNLAKIILCTNCLRTLPSQPVTELKNVIINELKKAMAVERLK